MRRSARLSLSTTLRRSGEPSPDRCRPATRRLHTNKLLQRVTARRYQSAIAARRHYDLGYIEVATRVHADVVGGEKVAGRARVASATPPRLQPAAAVEDADPPASGILRWRRRARPHARAVTQFRHIDIASRVDEYLARPGDVAPFRQKIAVRTE